MCLDRPLARLPQGNKAWAELPYRGGGCPRHKPAAGMSAPRSRASQRAAAHPLCSHSHAGRAGPGPRETGCGPRLNEQLVAHGHWDGELHNRVKDGRMLLVEAHLDREKVDGRRLELESTRDITHPSGKVSVRWELSKTNGRRDLRLVWQESGVTVPEKSPVPGLGSDHRSCDSRRQRAARTAPGWPRAHDKARDVDAAHQPLKL